MQNRRSAYSGGQLWVRLTVSDRVWTKDNLYFSRLGMSAKEEDTGDLFVLGVVQ